MPHLRTDSTTRSRLGPEWDNIHRGPYWDLVHSYNTSLLGWLVLVLRRHVSSTHELTNEESAELGASIATFSRALHHVTGCEKVYQMQYSEMPGHEHVHMHIVPRDKDIPPDRKGVLAFGYLGTEENSRVSETDMNAFAQQLRDWIRTNT